MTLKFGLDFPSPDDDKADYSLQLPFSSSFVPIESKVADKSIDFSTGNSHRAIIFDDKCGAGEFDAFCAYSRETGTILHFANPWARQNSEEPCKIQVEICFIVRLTVTNDGFTFVIPSVSSDSHFNGMGYNISTISKEIKDLQPTLEVFGMTTQGTIATRENILEFTDKDHPFSRPMEMKWKVAAMDRVPRPLQSHITFLLEYNQTRRRKVREICDALCDVIGRQLSDRNTHVTVIRYGDQSDRHEIRNEKDLVKFRDSEPRYAIRSLKEALAEAKESEQQEGMIVLLSQILPSGHGSDQELSEELRNRLVVFVDRYLEGGTREIARRLGMGFTYALDFINICNAAMRALAKKVLTLPRPSRRSSQPSRASLRWVNENILSYPWSIPDVYLNKEDKEGSKKDAFERKECFNEPGNDSDKDASISIEDCESLLPVLERVQSFIADFKSNKDASISIEDCEFLSRVLERVKLFIADFKSNKYTKISIEDCESLLQDLKRVKLFIADVKSHNYAKISIEDCEFLFRDMEHVKSFIEGFMFRKCAKNFIVEFFTEWTSIFEDTIRSTLFENLCSKKGSLGGLLLDPIRGEWEVPLILLSNAPLTEASLRHSSSDERQSATGEGVKPGKMLNRRLSDSSDKFYSVKQVAMS